MIVHFLGFQIGCGHNVAIFVLGAGEGFGVSDAQESAVSEAFPESIDKFFLSLLIEIYHDISAEDDVERSSEWP